VDQRAALKPGCRELQKRRGADAIDDQEATAAIEAVERVVDAGGAPIKLQVEDPGPIESTYARVPPPSTLCLIVASFYCHLHGGP